MIQIPVQSVFIVFIGLVGCAMAFNNDWSITNIFIYISMPFINGFVGWITNVIALKMTFYPLEFVGIPIKTYPNQPFGCIGWQGIIPAKASVMAEKAVGLMTRKLIKLPEVFGRIDAGKFSQTIEIGMLQMLNKIVRKVMTNHFTGIWSSIPPSVQDEVILTAVDRSANFTRSFMQDLQANIEDVFDLKSMIISHMTSQKHLLVFVFQSCGEKEFVFIERSGFYFGFLFGIFQMVAWMIYPVCHCHHHHHRHHQVWWIVPVFGFIVGYITNDLALRIIFKPIKRSVLFDIRWLYCSCLWSLVCGVRKGGVSEEDGDVEMKQAVAVQSSLHDNNNDDNTTDTKNNSKSTTPDQCGVIYFQGLFLTRQAEVSRQFAAITSKHFLTPHNMWDAILYGPRRDIFLNNYLRRHVHQFVDQEVIGLLVSIVNFKPGGNNSNSSNSIVSWTTQKVLSSILPASASALLSEEKLNTIKDDVTNEIMQELPNHIHLCFDYIQEVCRVEETIRESMASLSSEEFEQVLHPIFEEDELKLILVGALLGTAAGFLQLLML